MSTGVASARNLMHRSREEDFAVGAFNVDNQETLVESEPHYFGGSSNVHTEDIDYNEIRKTFSTPDGARAFVQETRIDTFAAAVGNLHGHYPVPSLRGRRPEGSGELLLWGIACPRCAA